MSEDEYLIVERISELEQELFNLGFDTFIYNPKVEELVNEISRLKQEMEKSQEE